MRKYKLTSMNLDRMMKRIETFERRTKKRFYWELSFECGYVVALGHL